VGELADPAIVRLDGEHDIATRTDLKLTFQRVRDNPRVIVDLTGLRYIDSYAIDELFRAEIRARALDGKLVIMARNQRVIRLLSIAGLTRAPIVDTLDSALRAVLAV
jgi:anti-anti-sigma factor